MPGHKLDVSSSKDPLTHLSGPDRQRQINFLKELGLTLAAFFGSVAGGFSSEMIALAQNGILKAAEQSQLAGLRMATNDLIAMLDDLPAYELVRLDVILRERLGVPLDEVMVKRIARIRKVLDRGDVRSETEYYLLREHFERISHDPARSAETDSVQALLSRYQNRHAELDGDSPAV